LCHLPRSRRSKY